MDKVRIDSPGLWEITWDPKRWPGNTKPQRHLVKNVSALGIVVDSGGLDLSLLHDDYLEAERLE